MKKMALLATAVVVLTLVGNAAQPKLNVVASFYIPYEFTKNVGGDRVEVKNLVPAGASAHDYEPSPADIRAVEAAQVFVYNGASMDDAWVKKLLGAVRNRDRLVVIEATLGLPLRKAPEDEKEFEFDPHVWLDPLLAKEMIKNIERGLIRADSAGRAVYEANARSFQSKLDALDGKIRLGLANCRLRDLIISHQFLDYFAARYNLKAHALSGLEPEEPTARRLAELIELGKRLGIKYIFAEPEVKLRALEVLARELGAKILPLDPIEGLSEEDEKEGKNYLSLMEENLDNLRVGLECR
ncbi:MAG: zinc ABC transporter substrate-binding protein [Candidatus Bipolaricaulota bacterium]|nr:zinc ABC transporter substrate-binding protein [Candidatus Bipolaricaulota bacterium]MCS7274339.1 zinc ABC transporter substrate-binding protein [Candidatus Bipolaricaulota bacterium]MDW8110824.1 zinc ABC transporter substrate-binding protein [Candidatus Bipolaricaulota bacterium]MDW8328695.1 zinc ABC transporter substrate-binding protein [Candidatus Bipolaricaulota bacterium]